MSNNIQIKIQTSTELIDEYISNRKANLKPQKKQVKKLSASKSRLPNSLSDKYNEIYQKLGMSKPTLRIIHHLACSGGTLISKCISSMPNVFLLSEVHPYTTLGYANKKPQYSPSDIIKLAHYADLPKHKELASTIFKESISIAQQHTSSHGGSLVLRDHSHADFCVKDSNTQDIPVHNILQDKYNILSLVTLRNPIDSYSSLVANKWVHFSPASFEEYCSRTLSFLSSYPSATIINYEDFVSDPIPCMEKICKCLELPFNSKFEEIFDIFSVTGDSGRRGNKIESRERRELSPSFLTEIEQSKSYKLICDKYKL